MNITVLEVKFSFNGLEDALYPVILHNQSEMILVDCGYSGFMPLIEEAAQANGLSLQHLTGILLTHHDIDHVGGLYEIKSRYPMVKIYASDIEANYISGREKPLRLQQAEAMFATLPEEQKPGALQFQQMLSSIKPVGVDFTFSAEKRADLFDGISILGTPGHTPGHISIYLPEKKQLIAGDALVIEDGEFEIANPHFTLDLPAAIESVKKLTHYEIDEVVCYHGGVLKDSIHPKLMKLIATYAAKA